MRVLFVAALALVVVPPPDRPGAPTLPADVPGTGLAAVAARGAGEGAAVCSVSTHGTQPGRGFTAAVIRGMVEQADAIVRATAVDSAQAEVSELPEGHPLLSNYVHRIDFRTTEVLRGPWPDSVFTLPGWVFDEDDFNPGPVPYGMVRSFGLRGCYAAQYRIGGEYLLLLRPVAPDSPLRDHFSMTVWWMALGPTNEQIRGADDPWVQWVRDQLPAP